MRSLRLLLSNRHISKAVISRVSTSVSLQGSMIAAAPVRGGVLAGIGCLPFGPDSIDLPVVHPEHRVQTAPSNAIDMDTPTLTCPEL